jgi:protein-tyrosine phosphatase
LLPNLILLALLIFLALITVLALYLRWQASIKPAPYDVMFEVRDSEALRVKRDSGGWRVMSTNSAKPVSLRTGIDPRTLATRHDLTPIEHGYAAAADLHPHKRYFFEIELDDGQTIRTAERILPLQGAVNFRDLGGYMTTDGRRVAWGKVYRSDALNHLTENDRAILSELGIKLVCDLRSYPEVEQGPDRLTESITYRHMPIFAQDPLGRARALLMRHRYDAMFKWVYRAHIIDTGAPVLGALLKLAANPDNLPLVIHCMGGKDRTGVASALFLHICGVPRDTIVRDYSLTNLSIERILAVIREAFATRRPTLGFKVEQTYPLLSARPELIETAFAHIEATYGSVDAYLRRAAGLTDDDMAAIRRNLLDDAIA